MLAVALLVGVVGAVAQVITAGQMETYDSLREVKAMSLAEAMVEEIMAQPYEDPGGHITAGNRLTFDYMGAYDGYLESAGSIKDGQGVAYPSDYQVFSVAVTCTNGSLTLAGLTAGTTGLTITVTVSDAAGHKWIITQFYPDPS